MKKQTLKWMIRAAFLTTLVMLFARCEMGLSETVPADIMIMPVKGNLSYGALAMSRQGPNAVQACACLTGNFAHQDLPAGFHGISTE